MSLPQIPISVDDAPLDEQVRFPGDWWNSFDDTYSNRQLEFWYAHQLGFADRVVISDDDADGLTSVAVLKAAYPDEEVLHIVSGHGSNGLDPSAAVRLVRTTMPRERAMDVYITDLCLEATEFDEDVGQLKLLSKAGATVHLFDHHEWTDEAVAQLEEHVDDLRILCSEDDGVQECATSITFDAVRADMERNNPEAVARMEELAAVVMDHDLWIKQDVRGDYLSTWAHLADDAEEYISAVLEYGADILSNPHIAHSVRAQNEERERRIEIVREEYTDWYEVQGASVAVAYGDAYRSELGERLLNQDGADIAVLVKPWDKVSIRTDGEAYPVAHLIAEELDDDGGGHEDAAGCKPGLVDDYQQHWSTNGLDVKIEVLETIDEVLQEQVVTAGDAT